MNKKLELAKKLQALAKKGIGGEAINAHRMLNDLMLKHGITEDELNDELRSEFIMYTDQYNKALIICIAAQVFGLDELSSNPGVTALCTNCTDAQRLEYLATFNFYWAAMQREYEIFESAFIQKNGLAISDPRINGHEMDPEKQCKIILMMDNLDNHKMHKTLG